MRWIRQWPLGLVLVGVGCGTGACTALLGDFSVQPGTGADGGGDVTSPDGAVEGGPAPVVVLPADAKIGALRPQMFTAAAGPVTWSIVEGASGGHIDDTGKYVAPEKPGQYHVVATSKADPAATGTVTVTVVPLLVKLVAGQPGGAGNIDGPARSARFRRPAGVAYAANPETIVVSDGDNHTIRKWVRATNMVTTVAGTNGMPGFANGTGAAALFSGPGKVILDDAAKTAWVVDRTNKCIRRIALDTGVVTTLAGKCGEAGGHVDGANGAASVFDGLSSMTLGPKRDALYVCDYNFPGFHGIRRIELGGANAGATTSILGASPSLLNDCELTSDAGTGLVYYNAAAGEVRSFADVTGGPGASPATAHVASGTQAYAAIAVAIGGTANDIYASANYYAYVNRYHFPNASFDATPFVGVNGQSKIVDGDLTQARFSGIVGLSADGAGNALYVADYYGLVRKIDVGAGQVSTVLGAVTNIDRVDGALGIARLPGPMAVAADDVGNLYVAERSEQGQNDNLLRKIDAAGAVTTFSGAPTAFGGGGTNGAKDMATFGVPYDVLRLGTDLYVTDVYGAAIRKVSIATGAVTTPAGELNTKAFSDGIGAAAHFNFLDVDDASVTGYGGGLTTDGKDIYICDSANHAIRKLNVATNEVTTIAGGMKGTVDGVGTDAKFNLPSGIAFDDGFLYVADSGAQVVRRIELKTMEVTTWSGFANVAGKLDGEATVATLFRPFRIVADHNGSLFVSEAPPQNALFAQDTTVIRRIDITTRAVSTFAGTRGKQGTTFVDLPASFNCPAGLAFNKAGDLLVVDFCDGMVAALTPHL